MMLVSGKHKLDMSGTCVVLVGMLYIYVCCTVEHTANHSRSEGLTSSPPDIE